MLLIVFAKRLRRCGDLTMACYGFILTQTSFDCKPWSNSDRTLLLYELSFLVAIVRLPRPAKYAGLAKTCVLLSKKLMIWNGPENLK
jgi:hypothetical protein